MSIQMRNAELRELLHVQVSAAAAIADGGKMFKALDKKLAPAGEAKREARGEGHQGFDGAPSMTGMTEMQRETLRAALAAAMGT